ncbi:gliding motility-associated protein GldL [Anseongella ginsenosidimutans]|uniref:Gliding motility-associated protein GldL n=1 Tax=Anseongella ginsenosidimutans TaxID=496056 RepID=A0A4R3KXN7_9SPHI|nr:gliding motility protein GldL [Anseongella ginsenosidimutans]QEC51158.1 gliding motility protein GldL [Anseongella ginsenosidimutans]TCS90171.1 gliding motility-associated protein GldL [Anseongella ginsenosidimutans]
MKRVPFLRSVNFWASILAVPVILGVLFKLLHWPGSQIMLIVGLMGEALVFLVMSTQPEYVDWDWSKAYPELTDESAKAAPRPRPVSSEGVTQQLDRMLEDARIGPELINSLGSGLRTFGEKVHNISSVADAAVTTNEFTQKVAAATRSMEHLDDAYRRASESLVEVSGSAADTKSYHEQVSALAKNLSALNAVYEMELQDSKAHLSSMNKFYTNLNETMHNFNESLQDSKQYKEEVARLARNLSALNAVYGNMLSAMNAPRA